MAVIPSDGLGVVDWTDYNDYWRDADATWIQARSVLRYATSAARTTQWASPGTGQVTYNAEVQALEVYTGGKWVRVNAAENLIALPVTSAATAQVTVGHKAAGGGGISFAGATPFAITATRPFVADDATTKILTILSAAGANAAKLANDGTLVTLDKGMSVPSVALTTYSASNHAVPKSYVDGLIANFLTTATADPRYVNVTGDTMTGNLLLMSPQQTAGASATRKDYVDAQIALQLTKAEADALYLKLAGGTVTGAITINPVSVDGVLMLRGVNPYVGFQDETGTLKGYIQSYSNGSRMMLNTDGSEMNFVTAGIERARFDGTAFLVGKTASDVNVAGIEAYGGGSSFIGRLMSTTTTETAYSNLVLRHVSGADKAGEIFVIFQRSTAGSTAGVISQGSGNSINYGSSCDYRGKIDLGPVPNALDRVMQLRPLRARLIEGGDEIDTFMAHEVQEVVPNAVTGEKDGPETQMVDPGKMMALLTAAVQELREEVRTLRAA